jgi:hypothetical protein
MDKIDIINFTEAQYAALTRGQLQEVKTSQQKKNRLHRILQENLRKEKHKLVKNGLYHSEIYMLIEARLFAIYEEEVALIKDNLLFYLRYSMKPSSTEDVLYEVDYTLSDTERMEVVKNYYMTRYSNAKERFAAFEEDTVAPQYLGELYAPLHNYFWGLAQ